MPVIECDSVTQFLTLLHETLWLVNAGQGHWFFRGQGQAYDGLVPSLYREKGLDVQPKEFEGNVRARLGELLEERSDCSGRLISDRMYLLSLAQHYGCPTSMLDMTRSPLVAAYFAASGALKTRSSREPAPESAEASPPLVVYAIAEQALKDHPGTTPVEVRFGTNAYLVAQSGVLVMLDGPTRNLWHPDLDKQRIVGKLPPESYQNSNNPGPIESIWKPSHISRYLRFELARHHAPQLLKELRIRGIDAVTLFPGNHGFVRAANDEAWSAAFQTRMACAAAGATQPTLPAAVSTALEEPRVNDNEPLGELAHTVNQVSPTGYPPAYVALAPDAADAPDPCCSRRVGS